MAGRIDGFLSLCHQNTTLMIAVSIRIGETSWLTDEDRDTLSPANNILLVIMRNRAGKPILGKFFLGF